jgi:arsenate reductase
MERKKVLFVCTYNGARSRIAEEFIKRSAPGKIEAHSSCFESGKIGPLPIEVMREVGVDLPTETPKSVFERYKEGDVFDYVISLCYEATTEQCPIFKTNVDALYAKKAERISWSIPDFKSLSGTEEERKAGAMEIRDQIKSEVISFLARIGIDTEIG